MFQEGGEMDRKGVSCFICLDLLRDPVTSPCGHNYCMSCIQARWDEEEQQKKKKYSCPQCGQTFTPRPDLVKDAMLAGLVEELKKTGLQDFPAGLCYAEPEDVACDVCTGRKLRATKSCLQCVVSCCDQHLQPHFTVAQFKEHKLVQPSKQLQQNICSRKRELQETRQNVQQRIQDHEKELKVLREEVETINVSADKAVEDSEEIFHQLIRLLQERSRGVKQEIRAQQETEVSRVKDVEEKLEQEINELKRKDTELELLSHTHDTHTALSPYTHSPRTHVGPLTHFEAVMASVAELRDKLQEALGDKWTNVSPTEKDVEILQPDPEPEPRTRAEFLRYSQDITLDPNTVNTQLLLSQEIRRATFMDKRQPYPDHTDRFTGWCQVLSRESLNGRCYFEVEWREGGVFVSVAYKSISRSGWGNECRFGFNDKSWALQCEKNRFNFCFNKVKTRVSGPASSRVGVYLDHRAGLLSFYSVSETMTLLHRVQTTFTEPLYAGLWLYYPHGTTAEVIKLK